MRHFVNISIILIGLLAPTLLSAQKEEVNFEEIDTILNKVILKKEMMGGGMIHTQGWGVLFRKGYNVNAFKKNLWEAELVGIRPKKQVRVNFYGAYYSNANSYVYDKLNKVFIMRGGVGQQRLITRKPYWGGVEVRASYSGGISFGISKPVYLQIITQYNPIITISKKYDPETHDIDNIYGRASFFDGIEETRFYPGLYLKGGINFYFGQYNTSIKSLEAGIVVDGYISSIPIMAFSDEHQYFVNLYVSFTFGKRYNKF
nr:hypothetical protein [Bacteroidota bacterium]